MNQASLGESLEITPISLTRLLDRMEACGWLERIASGEDRRAFVIRLTRKARAIFPRVLEVGDEVAEEGLRGLSGAERETLIRLLQRVRSNFVEEIGERAGRAWEGELHPGDYVSAEMHVICGECPQCHEPKAPHRVCTNCGYYRGRQARAVDEE